MQIFVDRNFFYESNYFQYIDDANNPRDNFDRN